MKSVESDHYGWRLFSMCFAAFALQLDMFSFIMSLPTISRHFDVGTDTVALAIICYFLFRGSSLLVVGRIEDVLGLKRALVWGFLIFTLGALGAGLAPSISLLILARCVQGLAAAILVSSVYAIVSVLLPLEKRGGAFGLISGSAGLGVAVGAPLGGVISGWLSWRGIFFVDIGMGLLGAAFAFKTLPSVGKSAKGLWSNFDILGAILSFLAVFLALFALNRVNQLGWDFPIIIGCGLASVALGVLFVFREKRSAAPLVDLTLIRNTGLVCALVVGVLMFAVISGNALLMPFYLEMIGGMQPQSAGSVFLIWALTVALTSPIAGRMADRFSPRVLVSGAFLLGMGACLFFVFMLGAPGNVSYVAFLLVFGLSVSSFLSPNNHAIMRHAPQGGKGAFSSLYNVFNNLGWAIGACLFEAVFSHFVPHGRDGALHSGVSRGLLVEGFQYTYALAVALLLAGLILSVYLLATRSGPETSKAGQL